MRPRSADTHLRSLRHLDMGFAGEDRLQGGGLVAGQQPGAGVQNPGDLLGWIPRTTPVPERGLLRSLAALINLLPSQGHDREGVHHRRRLW